MADNTIKQRITLDGADDVIKKLEQMGDKGAGALKALKTAADQQPLASVSQHFEKLQAQTPGFVNGLNSAIGSFGSLGGAMQLVLGYTGPIGIAFGALGGTLLAIAKNSNDAVVQTSRMAKALGLSTQELQAFQSVGRKVGLDTEKLTHALARFNDQLSDAADKQKKILVDVTSQIIKGQPGQGIKVIDVKALQEARKDIDAVAQKIANMARTAGEHIPVGNIRQYLEDRLQREPAFRDTLRQAGVAAPALTPEEKLKQRFTPSGDVFARTGIQATDEKGDRRSPADALKEWRDKVVKMTDVAKRSEEIGRVMGPRLGPEITPFLLKGWGNAQEELKKRGVQITPEMEERAEKIEQSWQHINSSASRIQTKVGIAAAPALEAGLNTTEQFIDTSRPANIGGGAGAAASGQLATASFVAQFVAALKAAQPESPKPASDEVTKETRESGITLRNALDKLTSAFLSAAEQIAPKETGFASGGAINGPGSGTSDSIVARVSNGEYIVNASATARNRSLLDSINFGGLPRFDLGGFVSTLSSGIPSLGSFNLQIPGAPFGNLHPVNFHIGGNEFGGFFGTPNAVKELQQASITRQASQTGPRPSWYRG